MKHTLLYILLALSQLLSSCIVREQRHYEQQPVRCEVMTVHPVTSLKNHAYSAVVQEQAHIPLSLPYGGTVTELRVTNNAEVKKGDILLRVDDTNARQALRSARASLKQAQDAIKRTTPLHQKGLITDIQMVELQTKLDQANATVAAAQNQVHQCTLVAPQDGIITFDNLHVGQHLTPAVTVMTLLDMTGFTVVIPVPEAEVSRLRIGDSGELSIPALQTDTLRARLTQIGVKANTLTHTYPVEALISNPPAALLPGMIGTLTLMQTEQSAVVIPQRCVTMLPDGAAVWVVGAYSRAERRQVTLGDYQADGVQVTAGLNEGDRVVIAGYQKLYHDAQVVY